jgi:hypothetical protein
MKHGMISSYLQTNEGVNQVPNAGTSGWTTAPSCRSCRFRPNNKLYDELLEQIAVLKCLVSDFPKRKVVQSGMVIIYAIQAPLIWRRAFNGKTHSGGLRGTDNTGHLPCWAPRTCMPCAERVSFEDDENTYMWAGIGPEFDRSTDR